MGKTFKDQAQYDRKHKVCRSCGLETKKLYYVGKNQMVCRECYDLIELQRAKNGDS